MAPLALQTYRQLQAATSSQGELIVLLYRGAIRHAAKARIHMQNGDLEGAHNALIRAQELVIELMVGIKPGDDPLTSNLHALHSYIYQRLYDANTTKDVAALDEATAHLRELLETWEQVALPGQRQATVAPPPTRIDRAC